MSNTHWKSTITPRMDLASSFKPLIELAKKHNKVITVFDIEATTFLGRRGFGVTEIGMLHVNPQGQLATSGSFVNPEHRIAKDVIELTGITNEMVKNALTWKDGWGQAWSTISETHIVIGFNSTSFDVPALVSQHKRYELPDLVCKQHWDARKLHTKAHNTTKGKLPEVAELLGLDISAFKGHRAVNDALLTAQIFCALWDKYPEHHTWLISGAPAKKLSSGTSPTPVTTMSTSGMAKPQKSTPTPRPSSDQKTNVHNAIVEFYKTRNTFDNADIDVIASHLTSDVEQRQKMHQAISFELSRCIDNGIIEVLAPRDPLRKNMLEQSHWVATLKPLWDEKHRLAAIQQAISPTLTDINYIDVRFVLNYHNIRPILVNSAPDSKGPA